MTTSRSRTTTAIAKSSARRGAVPPIESDGSEWMPEPGAEPASIVESASNPGVNDVPGATGRLIEPVPTLDSVIESESSPTSDPIPTRPPVGDETISPESADMSQTSTSSGEPTSASKRHWRTPRNAKEWAAQLNAIATSVLNGTIDLDEAKVVSSISRSAAQLLTAEVQRARFLQIEPDLSLEFDDLPGNPPETPDTPE